MNLDDIGWAHYASQITFQTAPENTRGRIALVHRDRFLVWTEAGETTATLSGHLRHTDSSQPCCRRLGHATREKRDLRSAPAPHSTLP